MRCSLAIRSPIVREPNPCPRMRPPSAADSTRCAGQDPCAEGARSRGGVRRFVASGVVLLASVLAGCATSGAVPPGFFEVESRIVRPDRHAITAYVDSSNRHFRAIALQATGHAVVVQRVRVVYTQDDFVDFTEPVVLRAGQCSEPLPLPGNYRSVRVIEISYDVPTNVRATGGRLHVFALR